MIVLLGKIQLPTLFYLARFDRSLMLARLVEEEPHKRP